MCYNFCMEKTYYQQFLDTVKEIDVKKKPKLLLHVCCAPCSSHCLDVLEKYFDITVFYYNPNISPIEEYQKRLGEEKTFVKNVHQNIKVVEAEYDNQNFENMVKGLEDLPEGGSRCKLCYEMRIKKTGEYAKANGFDYFTTSLTVSRYKNSQVLNEIGEKVAKQIGVKYLFSDFKKENGYQHSIELSRKYGLYRQNYCGCKYSKIAREKYEQLQKDKTDNSTGDYEG